MKALILAGGRGNRLNEFSESQNKCMIAFRGKPLIEHILEKASVLDFSEIVMVVGYKAEDIINHYGISFKKKRIRYVIQPEQKGLVHAIECARDALNGEDFFLMLGDEVMSKPKKKEMIEFYRSENGLFGVCGILKVNDLDQIRRTYALVKNEQNQVFRLIEKPRRPINEFQGTGHCIFKNRIIDYIDMTPIHHDRGEKELPDLIQCCIDDGKIVKAFQICDEYANINSKEDLLKAEGY
jgi:dTDP-glucose pyrophosphorylase